MVRSSLVTLAAVAIGAMSADAAFSHRLAARQSTSILQSDYQNGATPPGAKDGDAAGQTVMITDNGGHDSNSQRAGCDTIFIGSAAVDGSFSAGWQQMPQVLGFDTMRDLKVDGDVVQPYIMETGKDASKIKRVIIVQPGLPRDYWKYSNLVRNSLLCASRNTTANIDLGTILIVAPAWLTEADKSAGAAQENDLVFKGNSWSTGSRSSGPGSTSISSFEVLDKMTEKFFDKSAYPNVNQIYVAGHSLGGALSQRYAMLRKTSADDASMNYFAGNPGAYVWPVTDRPVQNSNTSCAATVNDWAYGLSSLPAYGQTESDQNSIASRYYSRNVIYGLGLTDNEGGDSHCEAQYQGDSHLSRGQNFERALQGANGGVPVSHRFNYVEGVAHEDYLILSDPTSQYLLFSDKIDEMAEASPTSSSTSNGGSSSTKSTNGSGGASATRSAAPSSGSSNGGSSGALSGLASAHGLIASALVAIGATLALAL